MHANNNTYNNTFSVSLNNTLSIHINILIHTWINQYWYTGNQIKKTVYNKSFNLFLNKVLFYNDSMLYAECNKVHTMYIHNTSWPWVKHFPTKILLVN